MKVYHDKQKMTMYSQSGRKLKNLQEEVDNLKDDYIVRKDAGRYLAKDDVDALKDSRGLRQRFFAARQRQKNLHNIPKSNSHTNNGKAQQGKIYESLSK